MKTHTNKRALVALLVATLATSFALGCFEGTGVVATNDATGGDNIAVSDNPTSDDVVCPEGTVLRSRKADGIPPLECLPPIVDEDIVDDTSLTDVATSEVEDDPCTPWQAAKASLEGKWICYTKLDGNFPCSPDLIVVKDECRGRCYQHFVVPIEVFVMSPPPPDIAKIFTLEPADWWPGLDHCERVEEKW